LYHRTRWIGRPLNHCKLFLKLVGLRGLEGDENKPKKKEKGHQWVKRGLETSNVSKLSSILKLQ
jgi:hypothetical protein